MPASVTTSNLKTVINRLNTGGIVLLPTDTVFGLAVRPEFPASVQKLFEMKDRPQSFNLPVMVSSREEIEKIGAEIGSYADILLRSQYVPGPLTIVLGMRNKGAPSWLEGREEVAIRIPKDERVLQILRETGPLLVTSANLHGMRENTDVEAILSGLIGTPDLVLSGYVNSDVASTVVNCRASPPKIEREGQISMSQIERLWRNEQE